MPLSVRDAGAWKTVTTLSVRDAGAWKTVKGLWVRDAGAWKVVIAEEVIMRPDGTTTASSWTQKAGGTSLHLELDEVAQDSDSTYAKQSNGGFANTDAFKITLQNPSTDPPSSSLTYTLRTTFKKVFLSGSSDSVDLVIRLKEGTNVRKTINISDIGTGYVTNASTLSAAEESSIGVWNDLEVEFEATWNTVFGDDIEVRCTWIELKGV